MSSLRYRQLFSSQLRARKGRAGFTLIELLIVLAIVSVLLLVATPNYDPIITGSRLDEARMEVATSLAMARTEAIKRSVTVNMCADGGAATSCSSSDWNAGHRVLVVGSEVLTSTSRDDPQIAIAFSCGDSLAFDPLGERSSSTGTAECVFTFSDPDGVVSSKTLGVNLTGRVSL